MFRHGDVLILDPIPLPKNAVKRDSAVVAEGEVTGHAHRLVGGDVFADGESLYVVAGEEAALTHEEHKRLGLPPTKPGQAYPIIIQREYDDEEEWRNVQD